VLEGIEDVTARVNSNIKPGMSDARVLEAQKAEQAKIEKDCNEKTGLRSEERANDLVDGTKLADVAFRKALEGGKRRERGEVERRPDPYELPQSYLDAKSRVDPKTPVNFVTTADTTGGNSGSPLINRKGELIGLAFDGNIQSLGNDVMYTDEEARSVAVHTAALMESLRKVYNAGAIADELEKAAGAAPPAKTAPATKKNQE